MLYTRQLQQDSSLRNTMPPRQVLFQATIHLHMKEQITLHPLWAETWEPFQPITITPMFLLVKGAAAVTEGIHHAPNPATAVVHSTLWLIDVPITTHAMTHPTCIITLHPRLTTSPTNITDTTIPWTGAGLTAATLTVWIREHSQWGKSSYTWDLQPPCIPSFQDCCHPGLPIRFFLRFRQWLWFFKLLKPSPSSDEDEWGGQSSSVHYTIGLVSDCPTATAHAGKRFKALTDSAAALSLAHTSVYNMIEDCYKTKILPAVVHLKTADGSSMSSLGKATLYLCITNFKFSHTFIICDKVPETYILL